MKTQGIFVCHPDGACDSNDGDLFCLWSVLLPRETSLTSYTKKSVALITTVSNFP